MRDPKAPHLIHYSIFIKRISKNLLVAFAVLLISLMIGIFGYHYIADIGWVDSIHNASMILSGMGPVAEINNTAGKLFSSVYAIFSGVAFITNIGLLFAPVAHRLIHKLNLSDDDSSDK